MPKDWDRQRSCLARIGPREADVNSALISEEFRDWVVENVMDEIFNRPRVLVCGSRDWTNYDMILANLWKARPSVVIEGEARGADLLGALAARALAIPEERILKFPANWKKYGLKAGKIRNQQMLDEGQPSLVQAYTYGASKGMHDMIDRALAAGVAVEVYGPKGFIKGHVLGVTTYA